MPGYTDKITNLISKTTNKIMDKSDEIGKKIFYSRLPAPIWLKRIIIHLFLAISIFIAIIIAFAPFAILFTLYFFAIDFLQKSLMFSDVIGYFIVFLPIILLFFIALSKMKISLEEYATDRFIEENLERRIDNLAESLKKSTKSLNEIIKEVESRKELATKLQIEIEAAKLKTPEIEAVSQLIRNELIKERKNTLWQNIIVGAIFFILGVILTKLL